MDDFIHNLRMGKNRPNDRKRRHYDNAKFKSNVPPSSRAKKGASGRGFTPDNLGQIKKPLEEIAANQRRLIEIAEKAAAALETIATAAGFCAKGRQGIIDMAEATEEVKPMVSQPAPYPKEAAASAPDR